MENGIVASLNAWSDVYLILIIAFALIMAVRTGQWEDFWRNRHG